MSPKAKPAIMNGKTLVLGSITVIDTPLVTRGCFMNSVCGIVKAKPETTHDKFARDVGYRFVPGYKPQSSVDFLMNVPFLE